MFLEREGGEGFVFGLLLDFSGFGLLYFWAHIRFWYLGVDSLFSVSSSSFFWDFDRVKGRLEFSSSFPFPSREARKHRRRVDNVSRYKSTVIQGITAMCIIYGNKAEAKRNKRDRKQKQSKRCPSFPSPLHRSSLDSYTELLTPSQPTPIEFQDLPPRCFSKFYHDASTADQRSPQKRRDFSPPLNSSPAPTTPTPSPPSYAACADSTCSLSRRTRS